MNIFDVVSSHSAMLERITRGNYLKWRKSVEAQAVCDELKRKEKKKKAKDRARGAKKSWNLKLIECTVFLVIPPKNTVTEDGR